MTTAATSMSARVKSSRATRATARACGRSSTGASTATMIASRPDARRRYDNEEAHCHRKCHAGDAERKRLSGRCPYTDDEHP